jgi:hypothetical protein
MKAGHSCSVRPYLCHQRSSLTDKLVKHHSHPITSYRATASFVPCPASLNKKIANRQHTGDDILGQARFLFVYKVQRTMCGHSWTTVAMQAHAVLFLSKSPLWQNCVDCKSRMNRSVCSAYIFLDKFLNMTGDYTLDRKSKAAMSMQNKPILTKLCKL